MNEPEYEDDGHHDDAGEEHVGYNGHILHDDDIYHDIRDDNDDVYDKNPKDMGVFYGKHIQVRNF